MAPNIQRGQVSGIKGCHSLVVRTCANHHKSNRRLDNKLNIFEGIHRNYFFVIMNIIMVGGQVLIVFKGGQAFQIRPLNGKEWGMSIGLGAISIPWGVVIRLTPDSWIEALISKLKIFKVFKWKRKAKEPSGEAPNAGETEKQPSAVASSVEEFGPLSKASTLSIIRGRRATEPISRRSRIRNYGERVHMAGHRAMHGSSSALPGGQKTV